MVQPAPGRPAIYPHGRKAEHPSKPNSQCVHASDRTLPDWCADCTCPRPRPGVRCEPAPFRSPPHDSTAVSAYQYAPDESLTQTSILCPEESGVVETNHYYAGG